MRKDRSWILLVSLLSVLLVAGCSKQNADTAPQQSADDKAKMEAASREANMKYRRAQIEQSNASPEEKQRLLSQLQAPGSN